MVSSVPRLRSALFVPAHQTQFRTSALASGADAVILDLEDSVPVAGRDAARRAIVKWLDDRDDVNVCVRINGLDERCLDEDLDAAVRPGLLAVMIPKVAEPADVQRVAELIEVRERDTGIEPGSIRLWPSIENTAATRRAFDLASSSPRIAYMGCAAARNGDLARAIGFEWTPPLFLETLYLRSEILADMRAASVPNPMTGVVVNLNDLDEVEAFARQSRSIGYEGMMVIHPSHVPIVNEVFSATVDDVAAAKRLLEAWDAAQQNGAGALNHEGEMIDLAMVRVARDVVARAETNR